MTKSGIFAVILIPALILALLFLELPRATSPVNDERVSPSQSESKEPDSTAELSYSNESVRGLVTEPTEAAKDAEIKAIEQLELNEKVFAALSNKAERVVSIFNREEKLTPEETAAVEEAVAIALADIAILESQLIKVEEKGDRVLLLSIPPYPKEGESIKRRLQSQLHSILGKQRAEKIVSSYRNHISNMLNRFGHAEQLIDVKLSEKSGIVFCEVTRDMIAAPKVAPLDGDYAWLSNKSTQVLRLQDVADSEWGGISRIIESLSL